MENKRQQPQQAQRDIETDKKFNKTQDQEQTRDLNRDGRRSEDVESEDSDSDKM